MAEFVNNQQRPGGPPRRGGPGGGRGPGGPGGPGGGRGPGGPGGRRGPGGPGGRRRGPGGPGGRDQASDMQENVININRVAKVVKGGRRFSFSAIVTVGDGKGKVGVAMGKANEIADAIRKASEAARTSQITVPMLNETIPYQVIGRFGASRVLLKPASPGTGVIAAGGVRAILEAAGIRNILTKQLGSRNPNNVVKATMVGLRQLRRAEDFAAKRGLTVPEVLGMSGDSKAKKQAAEQAVKLAAEQAEEKVQEQVEANVETNIETNVETKVESQGEAHVEPKVQEPASAEAPEQETQDNE